MAAARQGLPVRLDRAPQRGAAFALTRASRRARTRSIGSRSRARGTRDAKQLVESLRDGGYVIVVRHGATFSDQADTDPFNFDNIAKQRNLNEKGKELAKTYGDAIRQVGIPAGKVYTSNFNRAFETAVLAGFMDIEKTAALTEGGLVVSPDENSRRAAALRKMLAQVPAKGKNTFLITHKPNIIDALGKDWFDVKEAKRRFSSPRTASIGSWRACKWRTGRSSLPSTRGELTGAA
jgi:phosphohistidine phosphatase SixA